MDLCQFDYHAAGIGGEREECPRPVDRDGLCSLHSDQHYPGLSYGEYLQGTILDFRGAYLDNCDLREILSLASSHQTLTEVWLQGTTFHEACSFDQTYSSEILYKFDKAIFKDRVSIVSPLQNWSFAAATIQDSFSISKLATLEDINFKDTIFDCKVQFNSPTLKNCNFINSQFKQSLSIQASTLEHCDFNHAIFENDTNFNGSYIYNGSTFKNSTFKKEAIFNSADLLDCSFQKVTFEGVATFDGAEITRVSFYQSTFQDDAFFTNETHIFELILNQCDFQGQTHFHNAIFHEDIQFSHLNFPEELDFTGSTFKGKVDFSKKQIPAKLIFKECNFLGDVDFSRATIPESDFEGATFGKKVDLESNSSDQSEDDENFPPQNLSPHTAIFTDAKFGINNFNKCTFIGATVFTSSIFTDLAHFEENYFNQVTFVESTFLQGVNFTKTQFYNANFSSSKIKVSTDFSGAHFLQKAATVTTTAFHAVELENAKFHKAELENAQFHSTIFQTKARFDHGIFTGNTDFNACIFELMGLFQNTTFNGKCTFDNIPKFHTLQLQNTNFLEKLCLINCNIMIIIASNCSFQKGILFKNLTTNDLTLNKCHFKSKSELHEIKFYNYFNISHSIIDEQISFNKIDSHSKDNEENPFRNNNKFDDSKQIFRLEKNVFHALCAIANTSLHKASFRKSNFQEFHVQKTIFNSDLSFVSIIANKFIDFSKDKDINFQGRVNWQRSNFHKGISLQNNTLNDFIIFDQSSLNGNIDFKDTIFSKSVTFKSAKISGRAIFRRTIFNGGLDLHLLKVEGECNFIHTQFNKNVNWNRMHCNGFLELDNIYTEKPISIVKCNINKLKYLTHNSDFNILFNQLNLNLSKSTTCELDFTNQDCTKLGFINSNLSYANFLGADIRNTRFDTCTWGISNEGKYSKLFTHDLIEANYLNSLQENSKRISTAKSKLKLLQSLYRQMKKRYEEEQDYHQAGDFHYWEMSLRLLMQSKEKQGGRRKWASLTIDNGILHTYKFIGDFGESYQKLFWSFIGWMLFSSSVLSLLESCKVNLWIIDTKDSLKPLSAPFWDRFGQGIVQNLSILLPSSITKNTLLDVLNGISIAWIGISGIVSLSLLTLFIMALRRKMKR